ncbi:uncharacterized protein LOC112904857 isoform X2 [Agrilus planipennis]|uniref:Uncharacterized protein LOC112904857 isoform X2 n=1 Tax=Agrilus planipennis TaxID=224129 RepID=A0A7F5R711_AGRPL|nr:uncharacterized protein LOC112904857 isoform X2 [Agrilus planipennis]
MCRPILRVLCIIAFSSTIFTSEVPSPVKSRHLHDVGVSKGSLDLYVESNSLHNENTQASYLLPVNEHRFPQISEDIPLTTSYGIREEIDDTLLKNSESSDNSRILVQIPTIFNKAIVQGRTLPDAGGVYQSRASLLRMDNSNISPNLIRAEIPQSNPPVIGTIGSGSLGYTPLGNGLYAVGSGSLGFAAYVPSQSGKGSITVRNKINKKPARSGASYRFNSFSETTPHAYPKPIDLKREISEQTGL